MFLDPINDFSLANQPILASHRRRHIDPLANGGGAPECRWLDHTAKLMSLNAREWGEILVGYRVTFGHGNTVREPVTNGFSVS
jgi:hypothetical protein